jgi:hypothetical protein
MKCVFNPLSQYFHSLSVYVMGPVNYNMDFHYHLLSLVQEGVEPSYIQLAGHQLIYVPFIS